MLDSSGFYVRVPTQSHGDLMTYAQTKNNTLSDAEWQELVALKNAINDNPASVHPDKMELFTELFVRSLDGKSDLRVDSQR